MVLDNALKLTSQLPKHIAQRRLTMPSFLAYCPDYPGILAKRLEVRAEHLKRAKEDDEAGIVEFGSPFLPRPDAPKHNVDLSDGTPDIGGSFMIYRLPNREAVWDRLKEDVYWKANIWNRDEIRVEEFCPKAGEK